MFMFVCVIIYCHVNYKKAHQHTFSFGRRINTVSSQAFIFTLLVSHVVDTASVAISTLSWEEMGDSTSSRRCCCRAGMSSWWAACRLLRIIEGLHHSVTLIVRACFRKQKVILKHLLTSLLCTIGLEVVHETSLGISHVARWLSVRSLLGVVESCSCCIWIGGKVATIFITYRHEAGIMLWTITIKLRNTCHRATTVRELASSIGLWLVESVSGAISSWLTTSRYGCKIASILITNSKLCI